MPVVAQTQYATTTQLYIYGVPAAALSSIATDNQQAVLDAVSAEFESYAEGQFTLPLKQWGMDVVLSICAVAAYELMCIRGFNPDGEDSNFKGRADRARSWWKKIQEGTASPPSIVDSSTTGGQPAEGGPQVTSDTPRGWGTSTSSGSTGFWD